MCLLTAYFIYDLQRRFWPLGMAAVLAGVLFFISFQKVYFGVYQQESKGMFSFWTKDQAEAAKTDMDWLKFGVRYYNQDYHFRYFFMHYRGESCSSSLSKWNEQKYILKALKIDPGA